MHGTQFTVCILNDWYEVVHPVSIPGYGDAAWRADTDIRNLLRDSYSSTTSTVC